MGKGEKMCTGLPYTVQSGPEGPRRGLRCTCIRIAGVGVGVDRPF